MVRIISIIGCIYAVGTLVAAEKSVGDRIPDWGLISGDRHALASGDHLKSFRLDPKGWRDAGEWQGLKHLAPSFVSGQAFGGIRRRVIGLKPNDEVNLLQAELMGAQLQLEAVLGVEQGAAQPKGRGTLFLWNSGSGATGGPNLDEPLVTDRPDFTESGTPVGLGVTQIEYGYTYTDTAAGASHSMGEPLVRYGIYAEWLEMRLGLAPVSQRAEAGAARHSGTEDLYFGFKLGLTPQDGRLPEMALIPQINIPTGSDPFSSDHLEPGVNWIYGWELSDSLSTAGNTQWNRRIDSGKGYLEMAQSWTLAYSLSEKVGVYTEWYGLFPTGATTEHVQHYFNGGFTYLITNDIQLDIRAGVGLNDAADDFIMGVGMSVRFP